MKKEIDAMGKECPIPVLLTKREIDAGETALTIMVDNQVAVENLKRLANASGFTMEVQQLGQAFVVTMQKDASIVLQTPVHEMIRSQESNQVETAGITKRTAIFIGKEWIGDGDKELGKSLMRMFFYTLAQSDQCPRSILFMNGGVKLPALDDEIPQHLKILREKGVEILVCGTCLNFYEITDKLKEGTLSNMYEILERLQSADTIINF